MKCCACENGHNNKMQSETFSINLLFFIVILLPQPLSLSVAVQLCFLHVRAEIGEFMKF